MKSRYLQTIKGSVSVEDLGLILPHEHLFTDLRGPNVRGYAQGDPSRVEAVVTPFLLEAQSAGITAIAECSTIGVGRNLEILRHLADTTSIHIIAPTGLYKEEFTPEKFRDMPREQLADFWVKELHEEINRTNFRAGFIKIAITDDGPTPLEERNIAAAAMASQVSGAAIACHTIGGGAFRRVFRILDRSGMDPSRFIWAHANLEPDMSYHLEAGHHGVFIEYDAVGAEWQSQDELINMTVSLVEAGLENQILFSQDAGWYDPGQPDGEPEGSGFRGYVSLIKEFLPKLRGKGFTEEVIRKITDVNPARAFAFEERL